MNVVSLKIKNFLCISDVEIKPGQVNHIVGKNNQGKSSILKALKFAISGSADGNLVKHGEDAAEVIVELSDSTQIRRRINSKGRQSVDVKREGFKAQAPQALLEELFGSSAFNPLELLDPKKRTSAILNSIDLKVTPPQLARELGIDEAELPFLNFEQHGLAVLDEAHKYYYQRRTEANKDMAEKKRRFETYREDMPAAPSVPFLTKDEVYAAISSAEEKLVEIDKSISEIDRLLENKNQALKKINQLSARVTEIDAKIRELNTLRKETVDRLKEIEKACPNEIPDKSELLVRQGDIKADIEQHRSILKDIAAIENYEKQKNHVEVLKADYEKAKEFSAALSQKVDALAGEAKRKLMASAEMPVPGLEFRNGEFYVDGIAVDNLSSSRALKLAIGVARKLSKKTKVICIDGAELLDEENYAVLRSEIDGDGYTYFFTRVGAPFDGSAGDQVIEMKEGAPA